MCKWNNAFVPEVVLKSCYIIFWSIPIETHYRGRILGTPLNIMQHNGGTFTALCDDKTWTKQSVTTCTSWEFDTTLCKDIKLCVVGVGGEWFSYFHVLHFVLLVSNIFKSWIIHIMEKIKTILNEEILLFFLPFISTNDTKTFVVPRGQTPSCFMSSSCSDVSEVPEVDLRR